MIARSLPIFLAALAPAAACGQPAPGRRAEGAAPRERADASPPAPAKKLEPPGGRVVHGMGQWEENNAKLLPRLPAALRPAAELVFIDSFD